MRNAFKDLDRKPERKRQLGRPMCRRKDAIKTVFKEIIWEGLDRVCCLRIQGHDGHV
jgi:hypothetical protein